MALVTQFLSSVRGFVLQQDGDRLCDWLRVEQTVPSQYYELKQQLRSSFPAQSKSLERIVEKCLPEEEDVAEGKGSPWPGFVSFMTDFLQYWRDVDFDNLLSLHELLSALLTYVYQTASCYGRTVSSFHTDHAPPRYRIPRMGP